MIDDENNCHNYCIGFYGEYIPQTPDKGNHDLHITQTSVKIMNDICISYLYNTSLSLPGHKKTDS